MSDSKVKIKTENDFLLIQNIHINNKTIEIKNAYKLIPSNPIIQGIEINNSFKLCTPRLKSFKDDKRCSLKYIRTKSKSKNKRKTETIFFVLLKSGNLYFF